MMGDKTGISWTDKTFNGWTVCTEVSEGCDNCYARSLAKRMYGVGWGNGVPRMLFKNTWKNVEKWEREAVRDGMRYKVFVMSMADWADNEVPKEWRDRMWTLIKACTHLDFQMLTKRHLNMGLFPEDWGNGYTNVHLGVSVENKKNEYRVDNLMSIPAKVHWISAEPLLDNLNWTKLAQKGVDWFVVGGESDQKNRARPFDMQWAFDAIEQCHTEGKRVFIKQKGSNCVGMTFRDRHGADPNEWPIECQVQEFPE